MVIKNTPYAEPNHHQFINQHHHDLLEAASRLTSIQTDIEIQPVLVKLSDNYYQESLSHEQEQHLRRLEHLLLLLSERCKKLEIDFIKCYCINLLPVISLFKFIPACQRVSFDNLKLKAETLVIISKVLSIGESRSLRSISFRSCGLHDAELRCLLPNLLLIQDVVLCGNPGIRMAAYKELYVAIESMERWSVQIKGLCVDHALVKDVNKLFRRFPQIKVRYETALVF